MEILQGVWKEHLRPRAVVGYGIKIFLPSPPNYVTRSPGMPYATSISYLKIFRVGIDKFHFAPMVHNLT